MSMSIATKQDYHRASNGLVAGGILVYIAGLFLLIAFIRPVSSMLHVRTYSEFTEDVRICNTDETYLTKNETDITENNPYWEQSYDGTFSSFKHMGLWQYCFDGFRFPYHQFDKIFDGCHSVYGNEFYVIREWLLPGWLLAIQAWMTLAFFSVFGSLVIIALIVTRYPLQFVLTYEWLLTGIVFLCNAIATFLIFVSVWLFWTQSSRRNWLQYPNFNHLSWSYYFAVISVIINAFASYVLYVDARKAYEFHKESRNLVTQMDTASSRNGFV